jgi:hypothetical protein
MASAGWESRCWSFWDEIHFCMIRRYESNLLGKVAQAFQENTHYNRRLFCVVPCTRYTVAFWRSYWGRATPKDVWWMVAAELLDAFWNCADPSGIPLLGG